MSRVAVATIILIVFGFLVLFFSLLSLFNSCDQETKKLIDDLDPGKLIIIRCLSGKLRGPARRNTEKLAAGIKTAKEKWKLLEPPTPIIEDGSTIGLQYQ